MANMWGFFKEAEHPERPWQINGGDERRRDGGLDGDSGGERS
jgi:hypothetical protein